MFVKYSLQTKITTVMKRNSFTTSFIILGMAYFVINMGFHVHHAMGKTGKAQSVAQFLHQFTFILYTCWKCLLSWILAKIHFTAYKWKYLQTNVPISGDIVRLYFIDLWKCEFSIDVKIGEYWRRVCPTYCTTPAWTPGASSRAGASCLNCRSLGGSWSSWMLPTSPAASSSSAIWRRKEETMLVRKEETKRRDNYR